MMKTFKEFISEENPYHNSDGEFFDPSTDPDNGTWSLYFSKKEKGRQRLKKSSKKKRLSLPNDLIKKCGRSGKYVCHTGKPSKSKKKKKKD
jgi:hypothetical protein